MHDQNIDEFKDKVCDLAEYYGIDSFGMVWSAEESVGHYVEADGNYTEIVGLLEQLLFEMHTEEHNKKLMGHGGDDV